jgi:hypothetical protein
MSKSQGQNVRYPWTGHVTRNIHVKYQSLLLTIQKLYPKLKFFFLADDRQGKNNMPFDLGGMKTNAREHLHKFKEIDFT